MQELKERTIRIAQGRDRSVPTIPASKTPRFFFRFFSSPSSATPSQTGTNASKKNTLKDSWPRISKDDLVAVRSWVALEEKIIHDYQEQKPILSPKAVSSLKEPASKNPPQAISSRAISSGKSALTTGGGKKFDLFGFLKFRKPVRNNKKIHIAFKQPEVETRPLSPGKADLRAIHDFVALEEKIIHHYHDKKSDPTAPKVSQPAVSSRQIRVAKEPQRLPAVSSGSTAKKSPDTFQAFSSHTGISSAGMLPRRETTRDPRQIKSLKPAGLLAFAGWLVAGAFLFLYSQSVDLNREFSTKLDQVLAEKEQIHASYAELKDLSRQQIIEMKWLNGQLQDLSLELQKSRAEKADIEKNLEQVYLKKLGQSNVRYEKDLLVLRDKIQTQNAVISALKAQSAAFEKIIGQAGMAALSGASAGMAQEPFAGSEGFQGEVVSLSIRQKSVVISLGDTHGARFGSPVKIFRSGIEIAAGRIDRVYPTMSVVLVTDAGMLKLVQPGDKAILS